MKRWLVKVRRYGGGTGVIADFDTEAAARISVLNLNAVYQTDVYYVEENRSFT